MNLSHMIQTIDTHTAGNPTRNVVAGCPAIQGTTMQEKMAYAKEHLGWLISTLMLEPRGHSNMSGTIWVPPCNPDAHMGILFIDAGGLMPMCGHSTIGCVTAMLESGTIIPEGEVCNVNIDTPAGLVRTRAEMKNGKVTRVTFRNVPSFLFSSGIEKSLRNVVGCRQFPLSALMAARLAMAFSYSSFSSSVSGVSGGTGVGLPFSSTLNKKNSHSGPTSNS